MSFATPITDRYFEDYVTGDVHDIGSIAVDADEMIAFAKRYDPQAMHVDAEKAKHTPFGGLIASGWLTVGLIMRLYVEHYLTHAASLASPGVDEVRFPRPVRPGDILSARVTVLNAVPSRSKPDRGIVTSLVEAVNQAGETALTFKAINMIGKRPRNAAAAG